MSKLWIDGHVSVPLSAGIYVIKDMRQGFFYSTRI